MYTTRDSSPVPNVSFIQRFYCTTRDSRPDPIVSFIQVSPCLNDLLSVVIN